MAGAHPIVLLTGGTGFIGFHILIELLKRNHPVRIVVRSASKGQFLQTRLGATLAGWEFEHNVNFVVVDDFSRKGAFDEAILDTSFVIHTAAPITSSEKPEDWDIDFKQSVIKATIGLLESAKRSESVKRIVITSSIAAIFPANVFFGNGSGDVLHADMRIPETQPPYPHKMLAYQAGKIATLNVAEDWVATHKPIFDLIHMHPAFTTGRNELATTKQGLTDFSSNWHALQIVLGHSNPIGKPALTCHIDDVAICHALALDLKVPGNQSFLIAYHEPGQQWDDVKDIVQRRFPAAVDQGMLPNNGHMATVPATVDVRKTEETFGFRHISYESQVYDLVEQYLELCSQKDNGQTK